MPDKTGKYGNNPTTTGTDETKQEQPDNTGKIKPVRMNTIVTVKRTIFNKGKTNEGKVVEDKTEEIDVNIFQTTPATLFLSKGLTLGLDNKFEFVRMDVGVNLPMYVEELKEGHIKVNAIVDALLQEQIDKVRKAKGEVED